MMRWKQRSGSSYYDGKIEGGMSCQGDSKGGQVQEDWLVWLFPIQNMLVS